MDTRLVDERPHQAPASAAWDVLDTLEAYLGDKRLSEEEGRQLLNKLMAVETVVKQQAAPPPPDF